MSFNFACLGIFTPTLIFMGTLIPPGDFAQAQDWPISNPPVEASVPQYRPPGQAESNLQPIVNENPAANFPVTEELDAGANLISQPPIFSPVEVAADSSEPAAVYGIDYTPFRDRSLFPVSPGKPCNPCTRPAATRPKTKLDLPGLRGRPYQDREPGGCLCGKTCCPKCNQFSVYWPRPFSACLDNAFPQQAAKRQQGLRQKCFLDVFDRCQNLELIPYQRKDNGYCGRGSDPYGCLGESRYISRVAGVDFRPPGEPGAQPAPFNSVR